MPGKPSKKEEEYIRTQELALMKRRRERAEREAEEKKRRTHYMKCPKCGHKELVPETDIINTWATSSLTPNIATDLYKGHPVHKKLYPMALRPQAHDIITFWLFNTVVKSRLHNKVNPWRDCVISGHTLDPKGKKISKSKGNAIHHKT